MDLFAGLTSCGASTAPAPVCRMDPAPRRSRLTSVPAATCAPVQPKLPEMPATGLSGGPASAGVITAAGIVFSSLSAHFPPAPEETPDSDLALRRQSDLPTEEDMDMAASGMPGKPKSGSDKPYMRHKLRGKLSFWESLNAPRQVLDWIEYGFMGEFHSECPRIRKPNQENCYEPAEQLQFVTDTVVELLGRGVIGVWEDDWGSPVVVSPLKVVPKKPDTYRLILDLSKMNKYLRFPRFKYASIAQVREVFDQGDFLFAWDLKDGYWHIDLHPDFWTYMVFEWEGVLYYFAVLPFGCAPACWVFTVIIGVLIAACRAFGLKCLTYIDDGLGGAQPMSEAVRLSDKVKALFIGAGFALNVKKSHFDPALEQEFIGYKVNCSLLWGKGLVGYLAPTDKRLSTLSELSAKLLKRWKRVTPREMARVSGYVVSLRPVFDPAALMFTKYIYIWIQSLIDAGSSYDWHHPLSLEAKSELGVWVSHAVEWARKALWRTGRGALQAIICYLG